MKIMKKYKHRVVRDCKSPLFPTDAENDATVFQFNETEPAATHKTLAQTRKRRAVFQRIDNNKNAGKVSRISDVEIKNEIIDEGITDCQFVVPPRILAPAPGVMIEIPKLNIPQVIETIPITVCKEKEIKVEADFDEDEDTDQEFVHIDKDISFNIFEEKEAVEEIVKEEYVAQANYIQLVPNESSDLLEQEENLHSYDTRYKWENTYYRLQRRNRALQNLGPKKCPIIARIFDEKNLKKYLNIFYREEIDIEVLQTMDDKDFQLVGLEAQDIALVRDAVTKYYA